MPRSGGTINFSQQFTPESLQIWCCAKVGKVSGKTRDCLQYVHADDFEGQSDTSLLMHVISIQPDSEGPVALRETVSEFLSSTFGSRCKAIMCKKKIITAKINVVQGHHTIIAVNRIHEGQQMNKVDLSSFNPEVDHVTQEPAAVVSHGGSLLIGHLI